ncbi:MAG: tRNA lysidine(34) synthetase TilS [Proteobacteria bacterium]|nr:tRNA lysidine(34) synthetase TilS [Pseudomonadota bacterium]
MKLAEKFSNITNSILSVEATLPKRVAVAVSGGVDSLALSLLMQQFCHQQGIELFCVTIDHKFRANSTQEAQELHAMLSQQGINHFILESYLDQPVETNIEGVLREVRYQLLLDFCSEKQIHHLFIGHHGQDIAENFLIRLFRGSGIDGLAAMDYVTDYQGVKLLRPLLEFHKDELQAYLTQRKVAWFEDSTNEDEQILRNKIRKFLNSLDDAALINKRVASAAQSILQSKQIIEADMLAQAQQILQFEQLGYFRLFLDKFAMLPQQKAKRYLAWMLMEVSGSYYKPRLEKLTALYQWILEDKQHKARSFYGCVIEKLKAGELIIYREKEAIRGLSSVGSTQIFDNRFELDLSQLNPKTQFEIVTVDATQLNELIKNDAAFKHLQKLKNPLKKVFYTIPFLKTADSLMMISALDKVQMKFNFKTPLAKLQNR